jgi:hypothetical protein
MQFAAAYEEVNEAVAVRESRLLDGGDELFGIARYRLEVSMCLQP